MEERIENRVAKSGIITIDLEEMKPRWEVKGLDLADYLWQGLVLREKEYREAIGNADWSAYEGVNVYIHCSADAIIPTWAYMLLANALNDVAATSIVGDRNDVERRLWDEFIKGLRIEDYKDARVVIKGCSDEAIPETVYHQLSLRLLPVVKSLMFGEPCSTVPVFKRK